MVCSLMENKIYPRGHYVYHCYLMNFDKKVFGPNTCVTADEVTIEGFCNSRIHLLLLDLRCLDYPQSPCNRHLYSQCGPLYVNQTLSDIFSTS